MNYSKELENKRLEVEEMITQALKNDIRSKNLIDSGLMLAETQAVVEFTDGFVDISIYSTDYWKYVSGNFNVADDVMNQVNIVSAIDDLVADMIMEKMDF